jgi:ABC-2 type transport system permease protein
MPLLDLPALQLGVNHLAGFITALSISITATAYGILIGTIFKTPNQALNFGAISIVILSAIGGIWIPLEIMPEKIQTIGRLSPLSWGLDAINDVYLRNGDIRFILPDITRLLACGLVMLGIGAWVEQKRIS